MEPGTGTGGDEGWLPGHLVPPDMWFQEASTASIHKVNPSKSWAQGSPPHPNTLGSWESALRALGSQTPGFTQPMACAQTGLCGLYFQGLCPSSLGRLTPQDETPSPAQHRAVAAASMSSALGSCSVCQSMTTPGAAFPGQCFPDGSGGRRGSSRKARSRRQDWASRWCGPCPMCGTCPSCPG